MTKTIYQKYNVECGYGWKSIIVPLIDYVEKYNSNHTNSNIEILQIKEKFGGLRFYVSFDNVEKDIIDQLRRMIDNAEEESFLTCEYCGNKENVGTTLGWLTTICENCIKTNYRGTSTEWRRQKDGKIIKIK